MRRWSRIALTILSVVVVVVAFFVVPMPIASFAPGDATPLDELLVVEGADAELDGELRLLSVFVAQPSMFGVLQAGIDDAIDLLPRSEVFPSDLRRVEFQELQRENFRSAFRIAAAVGLDAVGLDVEIETAARVAAVVEDGPAGGRLLPGDIVTSFDGEPVSSADELVAEAGTTEVGQRLTLGVQRAGREIEVAITADVLPDTEQVGIGIAVETIDQELSLPRDVALVDQRSIGGPSAGLMVALTVYDLVADEDLTAGRQIAGTGTVDGEGRVGRVGGVREKAIAAVDDGVELLLVPSSQAGEARAAAGDALEVIGVDTLDEALAALR